MRSAKQRPTICRPTGHWLEYVDWAAPILAEPLQVNHGHALIPDRLGAGITWNEEAARRWALP